MADHSQADFALEQGWRAIAWTRDFDRFRATIMVDQRGQCMWRVQNLDVSADSHIGKADTLELANEAVTRIAAANRIIRG